MAIKVVCVNGSPHLKSSATQAMLTPFIEGMKKAGAEVDLFYVAKNKFKPCTGCIQCWTTSPGVCIQKDAMQEVYPKLRKADYLILGAGIYADGVPGQLKSFADRTVAQLLPYMEIREDHCRHVVRDDYNLYKIVFLSSCAWQSLTNFDPAIQWVKAYAKNMGREFLGSILRPQSSMLGPGLGKNILEKMFTTLSELGEKLIISGQLDPALLDFVSQDIVSREDHLKMFNGLWDSMLKK
jgi:FMN-dependent NADH-azoreductase